MPLYREQATTLNVVDISSTDYVDSNWESFFILSNSEWDIYVDTTTADQTWDTNVKIHTLAGQIHPIMITKLYKTWTTLTTAGDLVALK